jgi:osmotically-inducible protein OsmY
VSVKATDASVAERVSKALDEDVKRGGSRASEEDARAVPGVRGVKNELQVVPEARRVAVAAKDAELQEKVSEAIYARPELKRASIHVAVRNGVVRLTGTVPSQQHRLAAAIAARRVPGMRAVGEDLQVTSITEAEAPAPADGPAAP